MTARIKTTQVDAETRRRMLATQEGVLVLQERLRCVGRERGWCIVGARLVEPHELWLAAPDVQAVWNARAA